MYRNARNFSKERISAMCRWMAAHDDAVRAGSKLYIDPDTGYNVFTSLAHKERGKCCGNGCRHCPYDYINVKPHDRRAQIRASMSLETLQR